MAQAAAVGDAPPRTGFFTGMLNDPSVHGPRAITYGTEVIPRLATAGCVVGALTATATIPQVVKTSGGAMGPLDMATKTKMFMRIWPKAGGLKMGQYMVMRELKVNMDQVINKDLSTMIAFGFAGTFFQSIIYNQLIADMYKIYLGKTVERQTTKQFFNSIAPGLAWCFSREMFAMGGGLALGPPVKEAFESEFQRRGIDVPEYPLRFIAGFTSGSITSAGTQWIHNTTLYAGRLAAAGETVEAPFYTASSIRLTYKELGVSMFYLNLPQRLQLVAGAVALMNMLDIWHRRDLKMF